MGGWEGGVKGIPKRGLTEKGFGNLKAPNTSLSSITEGRTSIGSCQYRGGPAGLFTILVVNILWLLFPKFVKYAGHRRFFNLMRCDASDLSRPLSIPTPPPLPPSPLPVHARRSGPHEKSLRRGVRVALWGSVWVMS